MPEENTVYLSTEWLTWVIVAAIMLISMVLISLKVNGHAFGFLIDSRNKYSLSRLQLIFWTWLILSAVLAVGFELGSMNIAVPEEVWALLGISLGSTAGAVIVKANKNEKPKDEHGEEKPVEDTKNLPQPQNLDIKDARFSDMFKGEEKEDYTTVDIGKVQMFFITVGVWFGYLVMLYGYPFTKSEGDLVSFPGLSAGLVAMIGISHAGYLTVKAAPKKK